MANKDILIFAQLFLATAIGDALIQRPLNVATSVGGQTVFNCSSDTTGALTWLYTTNCNTAGGDVLTDSSCNIISSYSSHYRTEKPGGFVCNLMVFDAMLSLGGCYACADGFGTGRQYQAMLIVVDSNANITSNSTDLVSGEDVMISTSVSYRGPSIPLQPPSLPPSFYWTLQSDPNQNITSYQGSTTNTTASSYIVAKAQKPVVPPYLCNLFFNPPIYVPPSCASNAPTYRTSWETPTYCVSDRLNIPTLVIAMYFGINLLFFSIFFVYYGCSNSGRKTLNDQFPWLQKMLPCLNDDGCECSVWIFYFVLLSIFVAFVFFPTILIMTSCCKKKKKTSQGIMQQNERNGRGAGGTQLNTLETTPYQYPSRASATSNPPPSLNTSANFQQDQTDRPYPHSSTQQHQPTYWGNSGPYPQNPRNLQLPLQTPSPALSSGAIVYAELGGDNQPKIRRPIQPLQTDANTYADIAMA